MVGQIFSFISCVAISTNSLNTKLVCITLALYLLNETPFSVYTLFATVKHFLCTQAHFYEKIFCYRLDAELGLIPHSLFLGQMPV